MTTHPSRATAPALDPSKISYPTSLPIVLKRDEIVNALRAHQVIIIAGETGSGKTTQLPKMCLEAGIGRKGKIACTQPRRIAALSVSRRLAQELGVSWGHDVGCKVRFADHTRRDTLVKVMTDGVLLGEIRGDPKLLTYEAIIIDEAHERSLTIDFLLGYLKQLLPRRPDLKVIITSATIDTELFSKAFNNAPIFQVSGRLFPVDIRYRPLSSFDEEEDVSHVRGAVEAIQDITSESHEGDILVFMPTERDIREVCDLLHNEQGKNAEVLPLMGSLSAAEQERVFAKSEKRKVIVATNIAETSLTIPGIKFVIDSGLARISRYHPKQRVRRLPVERIAQSNANQRAGRAGRIEAGVCIRLFEKDDFEARPAFAEPEILRANLAEVILRMKAYTLGDITSFPFLNPPEPRAIKSGLALLHELGALDPDGEVSPLGKELARLPVDPTIGRMLLQARRERCLPEIVVIAAALSLQDPRERSAEIREKADRAHKAFSHPDSDFLTLIKIWVECAREVGPNRSKSALRKFCKARFLSSVRMREWGDLISELAGEMNVDVTSLADPVTIERFDGRYRAIHRAILSGFIGQVAFRLSANTYRAVGGRELSMWPGSSLAERGRSPVDRSNSAVRTRVSQRRWIVSSEMVETSRIFARNNARVLIDWIEELSCHSSKRSCSEPRWCSERRAVIADERVTLYGLELSSRKILYGRQNPEAARDIFIQSGLLVAEGGVSLPWVVDNRAVVNKVAMVLASQGRLNRIELQERFARFYRENLPMLSSETELMKYTSGPNSRNLAGLTVSFEDLIKGEPGEDLERQFPDSIAVAGQDIHVWYSYNPGSKSDGVTLELPSELANSVSPELLEGIIPGLREQQVLHLLHDLPKDLRRRLGPLVAAARRIACHPAIRRLPLVRGVREALREDFDIMLPQEVVDSSSLPSHLRPKIRLRTAEDLPGGGDHLDVTGAVSDAVVELNQRGGQDLWREARETWEREDLSAWDFGDLPESVEVGRLADAQIVLYPTLKCEGDRIAIRLVYSREEALAFGSRGQRALAERILSKDISELRKQSRDVERLRPQIALWRPIEEVRKDILQCAMNYAFADSANFSGTQQAFQELIDTARKRVPNLISLIIDMSKAIIESRKSLLQVKTEYRGMRTDLDALVPLDVLVTTPFEHLREIPRYLRAMILRCERMDTNPLRYEQCVRQLHTYMGHLPTLPDERRAELRWMLEELKVSFFAQELGTRYPISPKRIDTWLAACSPVSSNKV